MPINAQRISQDIEAIARFSEAAANVGFARPTFSKPWRAAVDYVIAQAKAIGCNARTDAAGNVHVRPAAMSWDEPAWLSGSHIDSVPTGGKYDGVAGIVAPLEILRAAADDGRKIPLELIIFAEEEGTTFGLGMIGSRLWTGDTSVDSVLKFKNRDGQDYFQAGAAHGVQPNRLSDDKFNPKNYRGLIEIHIEQGPAMWETNVPVAVVSAIAGRKQFKIELTGVPNHAGSTPMNYRSDALVAAAKMIVHLEKMARELSPQTVATVGRIECQPNAINVIPGAVRFTIDLRSPEDDLLTRGQQQIEKMVQSSGLPKFSCTMTEDQPAVKMDSTLVSKLSRSISATTISGALHDSAILAPHIPTAMIFVASKDGISHNPVEFSRVEDIAAAAKVVYEVVSQ